MDTGGYIKPSKETVGAFLRRWLDNYISTQVRPKTLEGYRQRGKHLIDGLGHIPLVELRPEHIHHYYQEKGQTLSAATLIKHHNLLRSALGQAVKWQTLPRNVAEVVDPPRASRKEMRALTGSEVQRLLETCQGTPWHPIFHILTWLGLRRSELLGVRWKDVDLSLASLRVVQTLQQLDTGAIIYQEPKPRAAGGRLHYHQLRASFYAFIERSRKETRPCWGLR